MIYDTILRQHLYFIPYNELRSVVERIYNNGYVSGIVAAYWTKKPLSSIKFDMERSAKFGYTTMEEFFGAGMFKNQDAFQTIDVTAQVQATFQMYQNLYGNKMIDLNDDISPFKTLNNMLAGNENKKLGDELINRTAKFG